MNLPTLDYREQYIREQSPRIPSKTEVDGAYDQYLRLIRTRSATISEQWSVLAQSIGYLLGGVMISGVGLLVRRTTRSDDAKKTKLKIAEYNEEIKIVNQRAKERWNDAYFCFRYDLVFIAGDPRSVPPTQFDELLWT